jgi:hypothetical protein
MLLIWGWKVRFKALGQGVFFCPSCGGDRNYTQQQGRRWFTLFFIPIIPLGYVGEEFIECATCRQAYKPSVLSMPTSASLGDDLLAATREALVWLLRQSQPGPGAVAAALQQLSVAANRPWSEPELQADMTALDLSGLQQRLAGLATVLNEQGKERLLAGCASVAAADGPIDEARRGTLDFIAGSLGMTQAHAYGVISQVTLRAGL